MVGDRHVGPAEGSRRLDHVRERQASVAEGGVHLEIGARIGFPSRVGVERPPDLGVREEAPSRLVGLGQRGRFVEPSLDLRRDPWPDRPELGR